MGSTMSESVTTVLPSVCPHCSGTELYKRRLGSGGGHGPYLLAGLGRLMHFAEFDVVVCANCGLTRFFAEPEARQNLRSNTHWKHVSKD
jgi:predicted nucleic-acid-binding Zn-ribbon protein